MKCLILAGGFATRLYPLTLNKAKALLKYRGKPIINHIIERVPDDIEILVSTNQYFQVDFMLWQKDLARLVEVCVEPSLNEKQKRGATGAIDYWIKAKNINEDLLVIAADNYFEFDLAEMISNFDGDNTLVAVRDFGNIDLVCKKGQPCQYGLVTLTKDRITGLAEKPAIVTSSIVATGVYILPVRVFPLLSVYCSKGKQDNLGSFISYLVRKDRAFSYCFNSIWVDIGDEILRNRNNPEQASLPISIGN
jgi:glucose-1-phosphate thymidylyltransferase